MSTTPSARTVSTSHHLALRDDPHLSRPFSRLAFRHRQLMIHAHITVEKRRLEGAIRTNTFNCLVDLSLALILLLSHNTTKAFLLFTSPFTPSISELSHIHIISSYFLSSLSLSSSSFHHCCIPIPILSSRRTCAFQVPKEKKQLKAKPMLFISPIHITLQLFLLSLLHTDYKVQSVVHYKVTML